MFTCDGKPDTVVRVNGADTSGVDIGSIRRVSQVLPVGSNRIKPK